MNITSTQALTFGYYVNLDERGCFDADLRNVDGKTLLEIKSDDEGEIDLVVDGFMKHKHDLGGIAEYAQSIGAIPAGSTVLAMGEFEQFEQDFVRAAFVLEEFDPSATISALHEENDDLADALEVLIHDFKLQDHGDKTIGDILTQIAGPVEPAPKKSAGPRMG